VFDNIANDLIAREYETLIKCVALSASGPPNAGPLGLGTMCPMYSPLRGPR